MNERIKKLAEQSGYTPLPGFDFANSLQEVFIEKFAELIVRECAGVELYWLSEQDRKAVAGKIKEHFGVSNERTTFGT